MAEPGNRHPWPGPERPRFLGPVAPDAPVEGSSEFTGRTWALRAVTPGSESSRHAEPAGPTSPFTGGGIVATVATVADQMG